MAAALRLSDLDWDSGHMFHPDERHILMVTEGLKLPFPIDPAQLLDPASPLNPRSFAYGSLIFYLLKAAHWLVATTGSWLGLAPLDPWLQPGMASLRPIGRALSALFDTGTVYLTYRLGMTLYGRRIGLLAAFFVAFSVLNIQLSHFYASDTPMTFFVTLTLLLSAYVVRWGRGRRRAGMAIAAGLALATKVSAAPVLAAVAAAHVLRFAVPSEESVEGGEARRIRLPSPGQLNRAIGAFLVGMGLTLVVFFLFQPYALIDFKTFVSNIAEQNNMVRGVADVPYTRQYIDRPAYWYFVQNLLLFGVGVPLGVAMLAGWLYVAVRAIREPSRADLLLLAFVVPYFAITGTFHAKFVRYLLPILPVLAIFAAVGLARLYQWAMASRAGETEADPREDWVDLAVYEPDPEPAPVARVSGSRWRARLVGGLVAFVGLATVLYALAYQNVYRGEHTAVQASRWIYANVPRGSTLANEHWEEGMPVSVSVSGLERRQIDPGQLQYRQMPLNLYEQDDERKLQHMASTLARVDYILFFSNRLYGTIPRLPARYPMTTKYYETLFQEELGFELVAAFSKYPRFGPVALVDDTLSDPGLPTPDLLAEESPAPLTINLGRADEAFSVYDHPKVLVFKKVRPVSEAEVRTLLQPELAKVRPPGAPAAEAASTYRSLLQTPAQELRNRVGGTYRDLFDRDGFANQVPLLVWVVALVVIGLAAAPIALAVFPRLPDGGLPLARTLGLLAMTWITWVVVAATGAPAGRGLTFVGLMLLIALGLVMARRGLPTLHVLWHERRRALVAGELAFWVPFAYFVMVRMANPDLWHPARGGEKPMDLAYLMAAVKSTSYPPYDPWFAGGFLNYYYFGQIISANLIKLTGVVPTTAYNLVVPTLFALTCAGAFSVAYNLSRRGAAVSERAAIVGGVAAAIFVTTLGNLGGFGQLIDGLARNAGATYQSLVPGAQYPVLAVLGLVGLLTGRSLPIPTDWYWASTRVIDGTINEFPYFTFLYADLHAHMIALPFTLLAMALAVTYAFSQAPRVSFAPVAETRLGFAVPIALPRTEVPIREVAQSVRAAVATAPEAGLRLLVTGLAVGALLPINSWDFPTYLGLVSAASLIPWYFSAQRDLNGLIASVSRVGVVALLSYALYLPFHQNFVSFYSGVKPTPQQSDLGGYLVIHGFFLAVLVSFTVLDTMGWLSRTGFGRTVGQLRRRWDRFPHYFELRRRVVRRDDRSGAILFYGGLAIAAILLAGFVAGYVLAAVLLALLVPTVGRLLTGPRTADSVWILLLFATGLALGIVCEVVAIEGDVGRMNTVFKFYLQVWVMWGVATAVALVHLRGRLAAIGRPGFGRWWAGAILALLLASSVYPIVATKARVADRFDTSIAPTLDGTAYMETAVYREDNREALRPAVLEFWKDKRAIEWIWDNVDGSPVIAEANTPLYRWGSRVSIYTGLPTIIGWDWHQTQQRFGFRHMVEERLRDLRALYSDRSPERAREILRRYQVGYVYVGDLERAYYPPEGLRKFDEMVGSDLELVYDQNDVRIYRVLGSQP